ncbi:hypothetical protein GOBAR_AA03661 [Gossypium barbadense]|uniref:Uncharacterized protein n=1 Tax=Gossypium barbadense TaxID=3634 RepID=A0A2P5YMY6_GOSBA|nr:hypothetical protein GOBAR_AA03661 [Gossypium barbadense]
MVLVKRGILVAMVCDVLVFGCKRVFAVDGVANAVMDLLGHFLLDGKRPAITTLWPLEDKRNKLFKVESTEEKDRWKLLSSEKWRRNQLLANKEGWRFEDLLYRGLYMTRASAYRDVLKSFIKGYQEGIQQIMDKNEASSKAHQEGNTDKNST